MIQTHTTEMANVKSLFGSDMSDVRKLLDKTSNEKAHLEIEAKRLLDENAHLKKRNAEFECEIVKLTGKVNDLLKNLEKETLCHIEAQNTTQTLHEELTFNQKAHEQELNDMCERIKKLKNPLKISNSTNFLKSLRKLRDQYVLQLGENRNVVHALYETKITNFQEKICRSNALAAHNEMVTLRNQIPSLNDKISLLEVQNQTYQERIRELEESLDKQMRMHGENETVIHRLHQEIAQHLQDYLNLMDKKVTMDLEVAAYSKLLAGKDIALNPLGESEKPIKLNETNLTDTIPRKRKRIQSD